MHQIIESTGNISHIRVSGMLDGNDYKEMVASWEAIIARHGKLRMLFEMAEDFHGWKPGVIWTDYQFDRKHDDEIERVAMVGHKKWEEWVTAFAAQFVKAEVKYFDATRMAEAQTWIREG